MRLAFALLAALLAAPALAQPVPPKPPSFTLTGEGKAAAKPDLALITAGVVSEAKTAREALDANTAAMTRLIAAVKTAGVEDRDVATSGFSVQPRYVFSQRNDGTQEAPRITGYEVRNSVSLRVRDLAKFGALLDAAVTEGSNQIDGIAFDIADKDRLFDEARKAAFADARRRAEIYAEAAGVKLGRLIDLSEQSGGFPPPRPVAMRQEMKAAADVPIATGEHEIAVNVTATWEVAP